MAVNQLTTKTCRKCNHQSSDFRPLRRTCRPCERRHHRERQRALHGYTSTETDYALKQARRARIEHNPHLKWCENGSHFVERSGFSKRSNSDNGLQPKCKGCVARNRQANLTTIKEKKKVYREQNREKICADLRDWYHNRCDKKRHGNQSRQWRQDNIVRYKQLNRSYYLDNLESLKEYARKRYQANKHLWSVYIENRIARKRGASGKFTAKQWQAKCAYFGFRCYLCHVSLINQEVHIEHRIPLSRGGTNWIANIAPACRKCNLRKHTKTEREFRQHLQIVPI